MANYTTKDRLNNMERNAGTSVFTMTNYADEGKRSAGRTFIQDGDNLRVGKVPPECIISKAWLQITDGFQVGTTLDVGFATFDADGNFDGVIPFVTDIVADQAGSIVNLPLPITSFQNPDGTPATVGGIGVGKGGVNIAVAVHMTAPAFVTQLTNANLVFEYNYIGTKSTGAYNH